MACLDVSNLGSSDAVASWVVAVDGQAKRGEYRTLRMRATGPDDFAMMREAVALVGGRALTEASGGITIERIRAVAETGVDLISCGALTHSAVALDISLDITSEPSDS